MIPMNSVFDSLPDEARGQLIEAEQPDWTAPMLATLTHEYFSDPDWIYERKLDGERCLCFCRGEQIRLLSRNRKSLNDHYPELEEALHGQEPADFIADGEVVAFDGDVTSFSRLQGRMQIWDREEAVKTGIEVYYYLFDLLYLGGYDLTGLGLRHRKALLKNAFDYRDPLRYLPHRNEEGEAYLREACRKGWEGIIAKRADGRYVHGRSRQWLKFKCHHEQEFVIGGYTEPQGERVGFGALLLGYYDGDDLIYAGKVGTGFSDDTLRHIHHRLAEAERPDSPFAGETGERDAHWADPRLVGEVAFTEWTGGGKLRHPRFLGLREDKDPRQVVREEAPR
mgnify:CR=1 FL=1